MSIFNEFNKKEKPVFTGLKFGFGKSAAAAGASNIYTWTSPSAGSLFSMDVYEDEVIDPITLTTSPSATSFEVTSGSLPSGITLSSNTLTGTLPATSGTDTTFNFDINPVGATNTARSFSIQVDEDESKQYDSNLKLWIQGGYNNRSTGNLGSTSSPGGAFPIARHNGSTGSAYGFAPTTLPQAVDPTSDTGWGSGKEINDSLGGSTKQLQLDKLAIHLTPGTTMYVQDGWGNYSGVNHTFCYWLHWDNVTQNTNSDVFSPTFHCWGDESFIANDWQTNGTSNPYLLNYAGNTNNGRWDPSNISGATNGNKAVWHHIALVYTSGTCYCYLNGSQDATTSSPTGNWSVGTQYVNFHGRGDNTAGGLPGSYTSGYAGSKKMADIRYYNTNLSAAAINDIYKKLRPAF
tara:strand:- start:66 stop:1280 length:1215 start_codon:yes stop_codon:yes gene_type:complete